MVCCAACCLVYDADAEVMRLTSRYPCCDCGWRIVPVDRVVPFASALKHKRPLFTDSEPGVAFVLFDAAHRDVCVFAVVLCRAWRTLASLIGGARAP